MSGGIQALRGFDYQSTVILDRLFAHFDEHGLNGSVRPEGADDLDLSWVGSDGSIHERFEQIKKPREDQETNPSRHPWTLPQVARELIPGALAKLDGNMHQQVWILGDEVSAEVNDLIAAGHAAPSRFPVAYWRLVHSLARDEALKAFDVGGTRPRLVRWPVSTDLPPDPEAALARLLEGFTQFALKIGASAAIGDGYAVAVRRLHARLPDVLARIEMHSLFGSEEEVALRVRKQVERRYGLDPSVVEATLFHNLRGFVNDIAKQPGRRFGQIEFEALLRSAWPTMSPVRRPPPLDTEHVRRPDLSARFTTAWSGRALEVIGVSGAGKTMLAAEVCERSSIVSPDRTVAYVEVRPDTALRDVLVGAAFYLRDFGINQPFAVAVECGAAASDAALDKLARALSAIPKNLLLVVDLIQGTCNEAFARDLATFVASLTSGACRIAVLGQESALRHLNGIDRKRFEVASMDIRGFNFDEFRLVVSRRHPEPDHALLYDVFRRVTAGRSAGLYAKLARSLADAPSLEAMRDLTQRPPHEIIERAEQQRFARISDRSRAAAEKLVCFALPFGLPEAEEAFPNDNVGAAVQEMFTLGLLRATGDQAYEMHEIVRAGLESTIAVSRRREAQGALAAHYERQGDVAAEVLHLERAGRSEKARERARDAFLRGTHWAGLAGFVTANELVTPSEVIRVMARPERVESAHVLPDVLSKLNQPVDIQEILAVLREQPQRAADYEWAHPLVAACLSFDSGRLHELIQFGLGIEVPPDRRKAALGVVLIAARRHGVSVGPETLALFEGSVADTKRLLLPFLLASGRREALARALDFMARDAGDGVGRNEDTWSGRYLTLQTRDQAIEFLAALPDVRDHLMMTLKSPLLGSWRPLCGATANPLGSTVSNSWRPRQ